MPNDEGLRERKKRETRTAISQAAIRLCVRHGWDNVTLADIAAEADVSERTVHNYFANKAEAIAASHRERALRIADDLRARPADEPIWDAITHTITAQYDAPRSNDPTAWSTGVRRVLAEPAVQGEILKADAAAQEELTRAIAERTGLDATADLYPRLAAALASAATGAVVGHWLLNDPQDPVLPRLRSVLSRLRGGIE